MAPSPEQDKEPKAPDKTHYQGADNSLNDIPAQTTDSRHSPESTSTAQGTSIESEKKEQLESLDEGQLRILLDEAATYRRPKDREGKSLLFKELLQKAEQDSEAEWGPQCYRRARRSLGGYGGGGRRIGTRPPLTHSGSLQDLAEGGGAAGGSSGSGGSGGGGRSGVGRSKHRQGRAFKQVSARSQQGGSLPSNVDQQHNLSVVEGGRSFLEEVRQCCVVSSGAPGSSGGGGGGDYIATVRCVNPEYYYPSHRADSPLHHYYTTEDLDIRSQADTHVSVSYTSRATLEIGSPASDTADVSNLSSLSANCSKNMLTWSSSNEDSCNPGEQHGGYSILSTSPTTSSPMSSSGIVMNTYPLPLGSCRAVDSVVGEETASAANTSGLISSQACSTIITTTTVTSSVNYPVTTASTVSSNSIIHHTPMSARHLSKLDTNDSSRKSLDENGNAVSTSKSGAQVKSNKKKKKNETDIICAGHMGKEKIDDIIKFIESDAGDNTKTSNTKANNSGGKTNSSLNNGKPSGKEGKSKDDSHEKGTKKRSADRKGKEVIGKLKKSNSMEELSRSKLDDLTSSTSSKASLNLRKTKKQSTFDNNEGAETKRNDRRSWGNDGTDSSYYHDNNDDAISVNTSNSWSSQSSEGGGTGANNNASNKGKKTKVVPKPIEPEPSLIGAEAALLETADFQTVTNKKKIRKRHSPTDEGRSKTGSANNNHSHGGHNNKNGRFNGNYNSSQQDRDNTKRNVEKKQVVVSSPPSDSNDDLEAVNCVTSESSGEKVQASYADMARAASQRPLPATIAVTTVAAPAPAASPPPQPAPPPNVVSLAPQRLTNFPDLIESCNYYSNERTNHDKYPDISTENTKNLLLKETSPVEAGKARTLRSNIVDAGTQVETMGNTNKTSHPIYNPEQYPALEPKQINVKNSNHSKTSSVVISNNNINNVNSKTSDKVKTFSGNPTCRKTVTVTDKHNNNNNNNNMSDSVVGEADAGTDYYVAYVEHSATSNSGNSKMENYISKPPDVVLPIAEAIQQHSVLDTNHRPPVIILNEELKKTSDSNGDIDGITFGFDINEQLLNGEDGGDASNNTSVVVNSETEDVNSSNSENSEEVTTMLIYNSVEFPPIAEQQPHPKIKKGGDAEDANRSLVGVLRLGRSKAFALRYLPPPDASNTPKDIYNMERLVHYVGMAWEDTIKSPGGKVRYFSE